MKKLLNILLSTLMIFSLCLTIHADNEVAQIGDAKYDTLSAAVNAVTDNTATTITLLKDTTEDVVIPVNKNIAIDLNGHTLTGSNSDAIYVTLGASLTMNATNGGGVAASTTADDKAAIFNNGTTTINGGTYTRTAQSWYVIVNHGTMIINDGTFSNSSSGDPSSLIENGYYGGDNERVAYVDGTNALNPTLTINKGTYTLNNSSSKNTIKNDDNGVLNIVGGTFSSNSVATATILNWNKTTISGGEFSGNGKSVVAVGKDSTKENISGEVTISGGSFSTTGSTPIFKSYSDSDSGNTKGGSITVNGGTYTGSITAASNKTSITVNEGTFSNLDTSSNDKVSFSGATASDGTTNYVGSTTINNAVANATSGSITILTGSVNITSTNSNVEIKNSADNTSGTVEVNGNTVKAGEEVKADIATPKKEETKTNTSTAVSCEDAYGKGYVWMGEKLGCRYKVTNTSVR